MVFMRYQRKRRRQESSGTGSYRLNWIGQLIPTIIYTVYVDQGMRWTTCREAWASLQLRTYLCSRAQEVVG